METQATPNRSDDITFIRLVITVERLAEAVEYLEHLTYIPNGTSTLINDVAMLRKDIDQLIARQRWIQGIGGAILVGVVVQIVQFFLKK